MVDRFLSPIRCEFRLFGGWYTLLRVMQT